MQPPLPHKQSGFSLLEVAVTLLLLSFGLLGILALMLKGQSTANEAYDRNQALAIAQDMVENLRANQGAAPYYVTGTTVASDKPGGGGLFADIANYASCASGACTPKKIAENHLAIWDGVLIGVNEKYNTSKIGGIQSARGCVEWLGSSTTQPVFLVSVSWVANTDTAAPPTGSSDCGKDAATPETRRRLVSLSVSTCALASATTGVCQ